jgi:hypothetical protein
MSRVAFLSVAVVVVAIVPAVVFAAHIVSIGDWGCSALGGEGGAYMEQKKSCDAAVIKYVKEKEISITKDGVRPILGLGDSFYRCGVKSHDSKKDAQWDHAWKTAYGPVATGEYVWLNVLGNHDYGSCPHCQLLRTKTDKNWYLPTRNWFRRLQFSDVNVSVIALDGSPCVAAYRSNNSAHWDPKDCEPGIADKFHANILAEQCGDRYTWLVQTAAQLKQYPTDVRIMINHYPISDLSVDPRIIPQLATMNIHLSLAGHRHTMATYNFPQAGRTAQMINGAGCHDDYKGTPVEERERELRRRERDRLAGMGYTWEKTPRSGFAAHEIFPKFIVTRFWDADGTALHVVNTTVNF